MSTTNLVPRSDRTGSLGTPSKRWENIYAASMSLSNTSLTGSFNGTFKGDGSDITGIVATVVEPIVLDFQTGSETPAYKEGRLFYDNASNAISYMSDINGPIQQLGQENWVRVYNPNGEIADGTPVIISGSNGVSPTVAPYIAETEDYIFGTSEIYGVATHLISGSDYGFVTRFGVVNGIDTSTYDLGGEVYINTGSATFTPTAPPKNFKQITIGTVISVSTSGSIFVSPQYNDKFDYNEVYLVTDTTTTPYNTITGALNAASNGDSVLIGHGVYDESDIDIPEGVSVVGMTNVARDVRIRPTSVTDFIFRIKRNGKLAHLNIYGTNDNVNLIEIDSTNSETGLLELNDITLTAGNNPNQNGVYVSGSGAVVLRDLEFVRTGSGESIGSVIYYDGVPSSSLLLQDMLFEGAAVNVIVLTGSYCDLESTDIRTYGKTVDFTYGLNINTSSSIDIHGYHIADGCNASVYFNENSDGSLVQLINGELTGVTNDILTHPSATGINTQFNFSAIAARLERFNDQSGGTWTTNVKLTGQYLDEGDFDDSGIGTLGELSVGIPGKGGELAVGEGDSTTLGMLVYGSGSLGWVDNTGAAKTSGQGAFTPFPDSGSGAILYVGNTNRKFQGIKTDIITPKSGSVPRFGVWEYSSGSTWQSMTVFTAKASSPYTAYANSTFNEASGSEQVRFPDIWSIDSSPEWTTATISGSEAYWVRFRLTASMAQSPRLNRFKLGTNRTEINADGVVEYFGEAEPLRRVIWHQELTNTLDGSAPANVSVSISPNITIGFTSNRLANNAIDGKVGILDIPDGLDTSRPVIFDIYWIPSDNGAPSDIEFEVKVVPVQLGDILNGTLSEQSLSKIETISTTDALVLRKTSFELNVSDLTPGEFIAVSYFRDATGGNVDDTFSSNIRIVKLDMFGTFWR